MLWRADKLRTNLATALLAFGRTVALFLCVFSLDPCAVFMVLADGGALTGCGSDLFRVWTAYTGLPAKSIVS